MTITAAQISTLTYTPSANAKGSARSKFDFTVNDGGLGTVLATMTINVTAVNDAPTLTVPGAQSTAEDVAVTITGIAVADVDVNEGSGVIKVTLSVSSGKLTVGTGLAGGLSAAEITGNGTGAVVLQGSIAKVNVTLAAGIQYLGNLNFNGTDTLTILADDLGNSGAGGVLTDSKNVSVRVLSPAEQLAGLQTMVEGLFAQGALKKAQANSLLKTLAEAQVAVAQGKPKAAYNLTRGFRSDVQSLIRDGVLTSTLGQPLLSAADLLLQSLQIGGGF
jgi:hypothetical protein